MKYFKFCKALSQALILIETSDKPMISENDKIIVLSESELNDFKYDLYFICRSRQGRYMQNEKKVKTGKAFLKHYNINNK